MIDRATAESQDYAVGDTIRVSARGEAQTFTVTGIASFANVKSLGKASATVFDLETARTLFAKDGYDRILVAGRRRVVDAAVRAPRCARRPTTTASTFDSLQTLVGILRVILLAFAGVAIVVGSFTIFNSLSITVAQRTKEFGLLRMVGASRRQVRVGVLLEALIIGLLASGAGIGVGVALAAGLNAVFAAVGMELPPKGLELATRTIVVALAVGTLATLVAAAIPARRATKIAPVAALRDATAQVKPRLFARGVRAVASVVGRPAAAIGGAAGGLARRNAMRNPGRTAVTASALMIGVALVTAVTVVAQGLEDQSRGALERHVQASTIVTAADGWSPIDPKIERGGRRRRHRQQRAPGRRARLRPPGGRQRRRPGDDRRASTATTSRPATADLAATARSSTTASRRSTRCTSAARFTVTSMKQHGADADGDAGSRSRPCSTCSASARSRSRTPRSTARSSSAATGSRSSTARRTRSTRRSPPFPNAKVEGKDAFIDGQTAWIGAILAILWVLLALAVIVSLFGIVNTLVLSTFERTRELGTLRALGMNRRQVRRMVRHESVITALIGAVLGIAAGLGLAGGAGGLARQVRASRSRCRCRAW